MSLILNTLKANSIFTKNYIYILSDELTGETIILDPVWDKKGIEDLLDSNNLNLKMILLTHSHPDHIHLAHDLAMDNDCQVYMSDAEISFYNFNCHNLLPARHNTPIKMGNNTIIPLLTPGHTSGSMCFLAEERLFTGDTLFIEGCGLCWGKGSDPSAMFRSLQMLKELITDETKIYPAHSYGTEPGMSFEEVLKVNIYLDFRNEDDFIKYRMRKNQKSLFAFK